MLAGSASVERIDNGHVVNSPIESDRGLGVREKCAQSVHMTAIGGLALVGQRQPYPTRVRARSLLVDVSRIDQSTDLFAQSRCAEPTVFFDDCEFDGGAGREECADPESVRRVNDRIEIVGHRLVLR